jgi:hypothetical protein
MPPDVVDINPDHDLDMKNLFTQSDEYAEHHWKLVSLREQLACQVFRLFPRAFPRACNYENW